MHPVFAGHDLSAGSVARCIDERSLRRFQFLETSRTVSTRFARRLTAHFCADDRRRARGRSTTIPIAVLLLWDDTDHIYVNRNSHPRALEPGVHGLSIHLDGTLLAGSRTAGTTGIIRTDYSSTT
jgi:hypothetical protein